jgi:hypothetical protein
MNSCCRLSIGRLVSILIFSNLTSLQLPSLRDAPTNVTNRSGRLFLEVGTVGSALTRTGGSPGQPVWAWAIHHAAAIIGKRLVPASGRNRR